MSVMLKKLVTSLWFLGLSTLIVFPLLAWPIFYFTGQTYTSLLSISWQQAFSIPTFISVGILFGLIVIWVTELPYFDRSLSKYRNLLSGLKINRFHAFFLSFCAGFGEEIFFRGAIQPLVGIWITAIFFVAIHGYFSLKNNALNIFAIGLTLFIALLGWAARDFTIWHAIAGHFSYDLVLLMYHRRTSN